MITNPKDPRQPVPASDGGDYLKTIPGFALIFDRGDSRGMRLNIPAGTAVRFEPGQTREVELVDGPLELAGLDGVAFCQEHLVMISDLDHPPITRAQDVQGREVFAFRQGCSYRTRLEAWYASDRAAMGRVMEIESYQGMLACVVAGSGVALMPASMLASLPGRESVGVHPLKRGGLA